jgi:hypothetical protein
VIADESLEPLLYDQRFISGKRVSISNYDFEVISTAPVLQGICTKDTRVVLVKTTNCEKNDNIWADTPETYQKLIDALTWNVSKTKISKRSEWKPMRLTVLPNGVAIDDPFSTVYASIYTLMEFGWSDEDIVYKCV